MISRSSAVRLAALILVIALGSGCDEDTVTRPPPGSGGPGTVEILATADLEFVETPIHVEVGTTVRWRNDTDLTHTVTPMGHDLWEPAEGGSRGAVIMEHTFTQEGTFDYRCERHTPPETGDMFGRIHVAN